MSYEERIGRAVLELTTDRRQFDQGMRHAHREAKGLDSQFRQTGASLQDIATRALALGAIAFGTSRFVQGIVSARMELERIENTLRAVAGSEAGAAAEFAFIAQEADRLGQNLAAAASEYAKLAAAARGTRLEGRSTRDIFVAVSEAATVLGLSADQTAGALNAIQQMISKGTVAAEELRGQLGERLPGAFQLAARAMGVTTQELGQMLQRGEVMAEDLLPKLATELRNTFGGEVEAAAASLRAEVNRLDTAFLMLRDSVSRAGLGDFFAGMSAELARQMKGASVLLDSLREASERTADIETRNRLNAGLDRIAEIREEMADLERGMEGLNILAARPYERRLRHLRSELRAIREEIGVAAPDISPDLQVGGDPVAPPEINPRVDIAGPAPQLDMLRTTLDFSTEQDEKRRAKARRQALELDREAARIYEDTRKPLERYNAAVATYVDHLRQGRIDQETYNRAVGQAGEAYRDAAMASEEATDDMSQFALQASRNMQTAFADFLFDPFDEGLEGMAEAFANTLRRMVAEAAAAQILGAIFPGGGLGGFLGGGLGSLFGGFRANGGPVSPGKAYVVGERGPEMFVPGQSGRVVANGEGEQVVININAPGADARTIEQIRIIGQTELVPQAVAAARSAVLSQLSRPRFA